MMVIYFFLNFILMVVIMMIPQYQCPRCPGMREVAKWSVPEDNHSLHLQFKSVTVKLKIYRMQ